MEPLPRSLSSPTLPHSFITALLFYFLSPFPPLFISPLFKSPSSYCSPRLFAFSLYFSLIFLSSAPFLVSFTFITVPFVDYQIPSLSHAFTFNSCHAAPCFTVSLSNVSSFERSHAVLLVSVVMGAVFAVDDDGQRA